MDSHSSKVMFENLSKNFKNTWRSTFLVFVNGKSEIKMVLMQSQVAQIDQSKLLQLGCLHITFVPL